MAARSTDLGNRNHLDCPDCGGPLQYTKDSRLSSMPDGTTKMVKRRRECSNCGTRHSTIECTEATFYGPVVDTIDKLILTLSELRDRFKDAP